MASSLPIFSRQRLSHLTDSGITSLLDSTSLLSQVQVHRLLRVPGTPSDGQQTGHTVQATPEQQKVLSSPDFNQALIGRYDDGHRLQFVLTQTPGHGNAQPLRTVEVYFTYPIVGTVRVRSSTHMDNNVDDVKFSFGPYLDGSATVVFPETPDNLVAGLTFQYTAMGRKRDQTTVKVPLHPHT